MRRSLTCAFALLLVATNQTVAVADSNSSKLFARQYIKSVYKWNAVQFSCLNKLWQRESGWNHRALNRSSGAYGIPQSLPASKMASAGKDWRTNPKTQIKWGTRYIQKRYKNPCGAWSHFQRKNWY